MRPIKLLVLSTIIPMLFMGWPLISNAANDDNNEVTSDPSFPADPNASLNDSVQILGWWSIPYEYASVARYKEMKDCGFTISYSATNRSSQIVKELAFADTAGMKCMVVTDYGDPVEEVQKYMTHPSLYAYWIYDEPTCSTFASLGEGIKKIKAVDPNHICYINLLPSFVADSTLGATSLYQLLGALHQGDRLRHTVIRQLHREPRDAQLFLRQPREGLQGEQGTEQTAVGVCTVDSP
jgi:hypothetical protein